LPNSAEKVLLSVSVRTAKFANRVAQEREHPAGGVGVKVAGGLIGEHEGRLVDQRAGTRDALLLPAGQLTGPMRQSLPDAKF
jgi:hypothetical protein